MRYVSKKSALTLKMVFQKKIENIFIELLISKTKPITVEII